MDKYEFKEMYCESSILLAHRGPYTVYDFFQYAIIRSAFTVVYGRGTGIYTCVDPETAEGVTSPDTDRNYIFTIPNPTKDDILKIWDKYAEIFIPHIIVNDYANGVRTDLAVLLDERYNDSIKGFVHPVSTNDIFSLFNQTWMEANRELGQHGEMREVFRQRKKVMADGVNIASMILNRVIEKWKNINEMEYALFSALRISKSRGEELKLKDDGYILIVDKSYHLPNIGDAIDQFMYNKLKVAVVIQPNKKHDVIVSFYAKAVAIGSDTPFKLYIPELFDGADFKDMSDDGTAIGSFDLDELIQFCHKAYDHWKELDIKPISTSLEQVAQFCRTQYGIPDTDGGVLLVSSPEGNDDDTPIRLKDPLMEIVKEIINKIKGGIFHVWDNCKNFIREVS